MARAFLVKIETEKIRARVDGSERIGGVGDATDFDADHS